MPDVSPANPATAPDDPGLLRRLLPAVLLGLLLLLLAFRLTTQESLRETIAQKSVRLAPVAPGEEKPSVLPLNGPAFTAGYAAISLLLAGAAAWNSGVTRRRLAQLGLIALIAALLAVSAMHAANRFNPVVGGADIASSLLAAWAVGLLCTGRPRFRRIVLAAIVAILALTVAKALLQRFVEFPDMAQYIHEHEEAALRSQGIDPRDEVQRTLFMSRVKGAEVTGFGAFSNVFAAEMTPLLALLAAMLVAALPVLGGRQATPVPPPRGGPAPGRGGGRGGKQEIPIHVLAFIGMGVLLLAGVSALAFTGSRGGQGVALVTLAAVALGGVLWKQVAAWRRTLLAVGVIAALLGAGATIAYGMRYQRLPSKSLMFRWHYWMGAAPMIKASPLWGVGLNNFGDYYTRYKLPSSPEDVKDPHNFLVRLAAETGLPATLAVSGLLVWLLAGGLRRPRAEMAAAGQGMQSLGGPLALAAVLAAAWVPLHLATISYNDFDAMVTAFDALIGWAVFAGAFSLLESIAGHEAPADATGLPGLPARLDRYLAVAALAGAAGMFLYDQINMALVTGPAALLFWMLLAVGDAAAEKPERPQSRLAGTLAGAACALAGVAAAVVLWLPMARGTFALDPAPWESAYVHAAQAGRWPEALEALNRAIALSPESGELYVQRIALKRDVLHTPVAEDIRRLFAIDRANARVRLEQALRESDLPAAERAEALRQALAFNEALPADELKRLSPAEIAAAKAAIERLARTP